MPSVTGSFNFIGNSYSSAAALPLLRSRANPGSNSRYQLRNISAGGFNDSAVQSDFNVGTGTSWSGVPAITSNRSSGMAMEFNALYYIEQGYDVENGGGFTGGAQKTTLTSSASYSTMFSTSIASISGVNSNIYRVIYGIGGFVSGVGASNVARKLNTAETASSITTPSGTRTSSAASYFNDLLWISGGSSDNNDSGVQSSNFSWNESSWTANTTLPSALHRLGSARYNNAGFVCIGGINVSSVIQTSTQLFNGTSWSSLAALANATYVFQGVAS